jgi:N-acetylneuraminic acid mutarotase
MIGVLFSLVVKTFGASGGSGTFAYTGSLNTARYDHTATLLPSGEVLVTGGLGVNGNYTSLSSTELYDPKKGRWTVTGSMSVGRTGFTATLLANGQVLVAGGSDYQIRCYATAELYNPATGQWTLTGSMSQPRCLHGATLLPDGNVLVSGGTISLYDYSRPTVSGAEIYNPNTGTWTATGSLNVSRASAATLLLQNGEVLAAGGYNNTGNNNPNTYLTSAELYDPSTGQWNSTASISGNVGLPTTPVLLTNGVMLIADDAQFYDPNTVTWDATGPLPTLTFPPTKAVLLGSGNVLGTGCQCKSSKYYNCHAVATATAFLYNFAGNSWSVTGSMNYPRFHQTMTLLLSGQVLVTGGGSGPFFAPTALNTAELYTP